MIARDNPFAPSRLEKVLAFDPTLIGTSWDDLESRWHLLGRRAAITGRHGAGKTSLLNAWGRRLEAGGHFILRLFFNREQNRLSDSDRAVLAECPGRTLLVDGDCHLPWLERRELRRASGTAAGILVARHTRGSWPELVRLKPDLQLARTLLDRAAPEFSARFQPVLDQRFTDLDANLRDLWLDCYGRLAKG